MKQNLPSFQTPRKLLQSFGFWREKNSSGFALLRGSILHLLFVDVYLLLQFVYIFKLNNIAELSDVLQMCLTYVSLFLKSINFLRKFEEISMVENSLGDLISQGTCEWQRRSDEILHPYVLRVKRIFNALLISSFVTVFFGAIAVVVHRSERHLLDKIWIPFDYHSDESRFLPVAFYQICGAFYSCCLNTALDIYPVLYLSLLTVVSESLRRDLEAVESHEDLKNSVEKHQKIRECFKQIQFIFSPMILSQAACSSIILCTTAFSISTVSVPMKLILFMCTFFMVGLKSYVTKIILWSFFTSFDLWNLDEVSKF